MGRAERRRLSKQQRKENAQQVMSMQDIRDIRNKANEKAIQNMWENVIPIFVLYLIDHFRCKENGVTNFLNWINEQEEWINEDPVNNLRKIREEVEERANVKIVYEGL